MIERGFCKLIMKGPNMNKIGEGLLFRLRNVQNWKVLMNKMAEKGLLNQEISIFKHD